MISGHVDVVERSHLTLTAGIHRPLCPKSGCSCTNVIPQNTVDPDAIAAIAATVKSEAMVSVTATVAVQDVPLCPFDKVLIAEGKCNRK